MHDDSPRPPAADRGHGHRPSRAGPREADEILGPEEGAPGAAPDRLHARLATWWRGLWRRLVLTLAVLALASAGLGHGVARVLADGDPGWLLLAVCLLPAAILAAWAVRLMWLRDLPERLQRLGADPGEEGLVMDVFSDHFGQRLGVARVWRRLEAARAVQASGICGLLSPAWLAAAAFALLATFGLGVLLVVGGLLRLIFG